MAAFKKNGDVRIKDYQSDAFCKQLAPLVTVLNAEMPDAKLDAKGLGLTVGQMLQFQEDALGTNSIKPRPFPKLPISLLEDVRPDGALALVAKRLVAVKRATPSLKAFEWTAPGQRRFNLETLQIVRADLLRAGLVKVPVVAAHPSCGADGDKALEAARNLGATVAESAGDPAVTHMLYPHGALCVSADDDSSQMRTLQASGQRARVHWRFLPDSYAEWVPVKAAPVAAEQLTEPRGGGPWRVSLRWALDSEQYNEWMNPQDYEADEKKAKSVAAAEAAAALGAAGAAGAAAAAAAKSGAAAQLVAAQAAALAGAKRARGDAEVDTSERGVEVAPGIIKRRVLNPHGPVVDGTAPAENLSQGQLAPSAQLPVLEPPPCSGPPPQQQQEQQMQEQQQQQLDENQQRVRQQAEPGASGDAAVASGSNCSGRGGASMERVQYVMPVHASWFTLGGIHPHERNAVPEMSSGSQPGLNIESYQQIRNEIVMLYRAQPHRRLTFQDALAAARSVAGKGLSLDGVQRVYKFLESWNIINWLAPLPAAPASAALPSGTQLAAGGGVRPCLPRTHSMAAGAQVKARAARGPLPALLVLPVPSASDAVAAAARGGTLSFAAREPRASRLESMRSLTAPRRTIYCSVMPWVDCTDLRYHCTRAPAVDLCPEAYARGLFPKHCSAADFVRLTGGADPPGGAGGGRDATRSAAAIAAADAAEAAGWSPQESLLLLEGMTLHGDNWPLVADHVGTHHVLECITHFLQLPAEDDFLDELEHRALMAPDARSGNSLNDGAASAGSFGYVPFAGNDAAPGNPVLSLATLLSVLVAPRVAAELAQAALEALASHSPIALAQRLDAARRGADSNAMDLDDSGGSDPDPGRAVTPAETRAAAMVAMCRAAARAKLMADQQEREMELLAVRVLEIQQERVDIKLKHLEQLEKVLAIDAAKQTDALVNAAGDKGPESRRRR